MKRAFLLDPHTEMIYDLTALSEGNGREIPVGRGEGNKIRLGLEDSISRETESYKIGNLESNGNVKTVSNSHATIRFIKDFFDIGDNGSTNGTFVNGQQIQGMQYYRLTPGAEVKLGNYVLFYEEVSD